MSAGLIHNERVCGVTDSDLMGAVVLKIGPFYMEICDWRVMRHLLQVDFQSVHDILFGLS